MVNSNNNIPNYDYFDCSKEPCGPAGSWSKPSVNNKDTAIKNCNLDKDCVGFFKTGNSYFQSQSSNYPMLWNPSQSSGCDMSEYYQKKILPDAVKNEYIIKKCDKGSVSCGPTNNLTSVSFGGSSTGSNVDLEYAKRNCNLDPNCTGFFQLGNDFHLTSNKKTRIGKDLNNPFCQKPYSVYYEKKTPANQSLNNGWNDNILILNREYKCSLRKGDFYSKAQCKTELENIKGLKYGASKRIQPNNYLCFRCDKDTQFRYPASDNESDTYSVWKMPVNYFPKTRQYAYNKNQAEQICKQNGLNLCTSDQIEYNQNCACGWTSNSDKFKNNPVYWMNNNVKGCGNMGLNICTSDEGDNQEAFAYCCGSLDVSSKVCPKAYPHPFSVDNLIGRGGVVSGKNNFCCMKADDPLCNSENIMTALSLNKGASSPPVAVPCINPPCNKYMDLNTISDLEINQCIKKVKNGELNLDVEHFRYSDPNIKENKGNRIIFSISLIVFFILFFMFIFRFRSL